MNWREKLYVIIYEAETPGGKIFDLLLLLGIVGSVLTVTLESVAPIEEKYGVELRIVEWIFTILFTIEYLLRIVCIKRPWSYAFSFFGLVDLLAIIPTYLSLYFTGTQTLIVIRAIRLLRVFRILKLVRFLGEANVLYAGLKRSLPKITVFLFGVTIIALGMGTLMFLVEGPKHGFTSIPKGFYWAVVTMTTVGYGDVTPSTTLGQSLATVLMILGYGIIAVPAGIVSAHFNDTRRLTHLDCRTCPHCAQEGLGDDSVYCRFCGEYLGKPS